MEILSVAIPIVVGIWSVILIGLVVWHLRNSVPESQEPAKNLDTLLRYMYGPENDEDYS